MDVLDVYNKVIRQRESRECSYFKVDCERRETIGERREHYTTISKERLNEVACEPSECLVTCSILTSSGPCIHLY